MGKLREETRLESERRIRAHRENAARYPHPGLSSLRPHELKKHGTVKGWQYKHPPDDLTLTRGVNRWVAVVKPDEPGQVMVSLRKFFPERESAYQCIRVGWTALIVPVGDEYRLTMSRVFEDAEEAILVADEVMG